jgi:hypothetical protein
VGPSRNVSTTSSSSSPGAAEKKKKKKKRDPFYLVSMPGLSWMDLFKVVVIATKTT